MGTNQSGPRNIDTLAPPRTMGEEGKELYRDAMLGRDTPTRAAQIKKYHEAEETIGAQTMTCRSKRGFIDILLRHHHTLNHIVVEPRSEVHSRKQIVKDMTREVFVINGKAFKDHTGSLAGIKILEEHLKHALIANQRHLADLHGRTDSVIKLDEIRYEADLQVQAGFFQKMHRRRVTLSSDGNLTLFKGQNNEKFSHKFQLDHLTPMPTEPRSKSAGHEGLKLAGYTDGVSDMSDLTLWSQSSEDIDDLSRAVGNVAITMQLARDEVLKSKLLQQEINFILQAMDRTSSGGDAYTKVMMLFPGLLIRASHNVSKDTEIHCSHMQCIVQTHNTFQVQFMDKNGSPLEDESLEVDTVMMEIVMLGPAPTSSRCLSIVMPAVEELGDMMAVLGVPDVMDS